MVDMDMGEDGREDASDRDAVVQSGLIDDSLLIQDDAPLFVGVLGPSVLVLLLLEKLFGVPSTSLVIGPGQNLLLPTPVLDAHSSSSFECYWANDVVQKNGLLLMPASCFLPPGILDRGCGFALPLPAQLRRVICHQRYVCG